MVIGIDLDGTITKIGFYNPNIKLPWWLFYPLVPFVLSLKPDELVVKKLRTLRDKGYEIIIVTARPTQLTQKTKQWLISHHIPFDNLFCIGFGKGTKERKLKIINSKNISVFVDDDRNFRNFLKNNSVNAIANIKSI